jgi:hypothetical protein
VSKGDKPKELTPAQHKAIAHLLAARNFEEAAKVSGISVRTLLRWNDEPHFHAALLEAEALAIDYAVRRLATLAERAVDTLRAILESDQASDGIRVRAALGILDSLIHLRELRNVEARLTALEQLYYADKRPSEY